MICRVCGKEVSFKMLDGRQCAVHTESMVAGLEALTPSAGQQRKLRQELERECRRFQSGAPAAPPTFVDDVKSVEDAVTEREGGEFKTFIA